MLRALVILLVSLTFGSRLLTADTEWVTLNSRVADLLGQGRFTDSERLLEHSIQKLRSEGSSDIAKALNDLGTLYADHARLREAERAYTEALLYFARHSGYDIKKAVTLGNFALLRLTQGKVSEAETLFLKAVHILTAAGDTANQELAVVLCGLADVYWQTKRYDEGNQTAIRALAVLKGPENDVQIGMALFQLGKIASAQGRATEAEDLVRRATELWRMSLGPQHPTYISGLVSLAAVISKENRTTASRLFVESLQILETQLGPKHPYTAYVLLAYATHLQTVGRKSEGRMLKRRADAILIEHLRENGLGGTVDIKAFAK